MRIAVLFYGRIRHFDKRYLLKKLDRSHEIDVFYSCSDEPDDLIDDFINLYEPVSMNCDKITPSVDFADYLGNNIGTNMAYHFINLKRVFQLLEEHISNTGIVYDLVIATRLDLEIESIDLVQPKTNTIYIPSGYDYFGINDRFAMGSVEVMKHYTNILDNSVFLLNNKLINMNIFTSTIQVIETKFIIVPYPEILNLENIKYCGLNLERFDMIHGIQK